MPDDLQNLFGGIDAGGTTFKCALADSKGNLLARQCIPTETPIDTINASVKFFRKREKVLGGRIVALGIGSFGPLDLDPNSVDYGTILATPKRGWCMTPLKSMLEKNLNLPVVINTDVNAALLAESHSGVAKGFSNVAYITVGTGIGAGIMVNGNFLGLPSHPEFGHVSVNRHELDGDFSGVCSFHGNCLEGLASAPALEKRFGDPRQLSLEHNGWRVEAYYLAQACMTLVLTARLERIVIGGGLMQTSHLISLIREQFLMINKNYLPLSEHDVKKLIVYPRHSNEAGLKGALLLATELINSRGPLTCHNDQEKPLGVRHAKYGD